LGALGLLAVSSLATAKLKTFSKDNNMAEILTKLVVDLSKDKNDPLRVQSIPLTKAEITEREAQAAIAEQERAEQQVIDDQTAADAQAGRDALVALGLTEAQINALLGA
jgi:hypothetical protein